MTNESTQVKMSTETKTIGAYREQMTKLIKFSDEVIKTQPLQLHDTANAQVPDETTVETVGTLFKPNW